MPLFARSFQELMVDSINDLAQNTSITRLSAGGIARSILEAVNKRLAEAYEVFDLNLARAFVSSAPGQYLDLIGAVLGVERESSVAAWVDNDTQVLRFYVDSGTFGDINGGSNITIPQGTLISTEDNNGGTVYRTTGEFVLLSAQNAAWISAEARIPGDESNVGTNFLTYHNFTNYTDSDNETLLVQNVYPIANGKNFESDANFRYRVTNRVLEAEAANITSLRLAALTTPGVADVVMTPRYRGIGTVGVIIKSTLPTVSQNLIDAVTANIQAVQAMGNIVHVRGPKESGLTMKLTIYYREQIPTDELDLTKDTIEETIKDFVNSLDIGETFYSNRLIAELFAIDQRIVNIGQTNKPYDELYIYTESKLQDNRVRQTLLGDYTPANDERVIIETTVTTPITLASAYTRR